MFGLLKFSLVKFKSKYCLFLLLLCSTASSADVTCEKQQDCYGLESERCGICVDGPSAGTGKCVFPFPLLYEPDATCRKVLKCLDEENNDDHCSGNGVCVMTDIYYRDVFTRFPYCKCNAGFYGRSCKHDTPQSLKGVLFPYIQFPYDNVKSPAKDSIERIRFFCGTKVEGSGQVEVVSKDEGHYLHAGVSRHDCKYKELVEEWAFKTRFPYKPPSGNKKVLKLRDDVLGYLSSFRIKVTFGKTINYQLSLPVFVSYADANLKCVPVVRILSCPKTKQSDISITRPHGMNLKSNVIFIADGKYTSTSTVKPDCEDQATYMWKIWKNEDNDSDTTYLKYYSVKELQFKPFDLEIAFYRVLLEVTSVQQKQSVNYAYCYFNIKFEPLVAIIDGGSERIVQQYLGVVLSTTRSRDPNMPPNDQRHMRASWSCVDTTNNNKQLCDPNKQLSVSNRHFVPPEDLHFGAKLQIWLKVWTQHYDNCTTCGHVEPAFAYATIIVANKSWAGNDDIYIQCLLNCNVKVVNSEQLYLKVKTRSGSTSTNYVWTYSEEIKGTEEGTDAIAVQGLPSFLLLVKEKAFHVGKKYTIVVKSVKEKFMAKYSFETKDVVFEGNCSMDPLNGTRGLSTFDIVCQNFTSSGSSFVYEFYDKSAKEAQEGLIFSGRMLGTSKYGELRSFRVTRGNVFVYIKDDSCLYTQRQFNVTLSDWEANEEVLDEIFYNISESRVQNDMEKMIEYISIIPDVIPAKNNKSMVIRRLLLSLRDFHTITVSDVKVYVSTLHNIFQTLNQTEHLEVETDLLYTIVNMIQNQVKFLSSTVGMGTELNGMSTDEIKHLAKSQLTCLYRILMCKDPRTVGVNEFDLDFETEDRLMSISNSAVEVIYSIQNVMTFLQRPGLPPMNITSENEVYALWVAINDEDYDLTNYLPENNTYPVSVSKQFLKEFRNPKDEINDELVFRLAKLDNIFWWRRSDVKSNIVSVSLAKHLKDKKLSQIKYARNTLDVQFNLSHSLLNTSEISDNTFQFQYHKKCSLDLDLAVKIHRLDPAPRSLLTLKFLYPQTNGSLRVLVYRNYRPECDMMKKAVNISEQSPNYQPLAVDQDEPSFYYIGIIPGPDYINDSVRYTLQVNTTVCQHWVRGYWRTQGCQIIKTKTKDLKVYCKCNQFSIFAAAFPVPPQEIDPFSDIHLFLTVSDNPLVVILVSVVLLIYFIVCLWAFCMDKNDKIMRNVIILDDNFPGDRHPYLLAVYTSSRFNAGTTAHVGVQIIGSSATSRAHILASGERKTLKRNYDDWFLIYYSKPLGELKNVHIWHDNAGASPDWFCDKIVVFDLKHSSNAVFIIEQWLALRLDCHPEALVSSATISEVKNVKRMFLDNCVFGVRDGHLLLSIPFRHPRSPMSRLQKISILVCCIMVAMLCSIMFYSPKADEDNYNVGKRDFYISIQSLAVCFVITFFVYLAFKSSYRYTYQMNGSTTVYNKSDYSDYDAFLNIDKKETFYASYVRFVSRRLKRNPLLPVQLAKTERTFIKRNVCFVIAWVLCIAIIVTCSFFVMLYGLKLGSVRSKMWLSSVFFTVIEEVFILGPLKIIILSLILSTAFQNLSETSTHQIHAEAALSVKIPAETEHYEKLSAKRKHPMYAPLRHDVMDEMMRKKDLRHKFRTVIDLMLSLCFVIVLCIVMFDLWTSHYHINRHIYNIVTQSNNPRIGSEPFSAIRNISQMESYLHSTLLRSLYATVWYNKDVISGGGVERGYWIEDFTLRKIGAERLRQIRVTPVNCEVQLINRTRHCIPRWNKDHEDTQDYSERWEVAQWHDLQANNSLWKYTKSSLGLLYTMYRLYGESGTLYHDGGYLAQLGPLWSDTHRKITDTIINKWQDQLTRAVFVEFTLFNVNRNLISHVATIVEYLISGNIKLKTDVVSVEMQVKLSVWNVLLAVFVLYYLVRSGDQINRQGLMEFLASPRSIVQGLIVIVGVLCFVVAAVHYFSSAADIHDFVQSGLNSYFDFDSFVFYFLRLNNLMSLLFCIAIVRLVLILRGGRTLVNYFYTITLASSLIVSLTVVIIFFLLLQLHWMFLLHIYYFYSLLEVIINHKFAVSEYYKDMYSGRMFLVKSLFVSFLLKFYIVIFTHSFRIAQTHRLKKSDTFNCITFIFDQVRRRKRN